MFRCFNQHSLLFLAVFLGVLVFFTAICFVLSKNPWFSQQDIREKRKHQGKEDQGGDFSGRALFLAAPWEVERPFLLALEPR